LTHNISSHLPILRMDYEDILWNYTNLLLDSTYGRTSLVKELSITGTSCLSTLWTLHPPIHSRTDWTSTGASRIWAFKAWLLIAHKYKYKYKYKYCYYVQCMRVYTWCSLGYDFRLWGQQFFPFFQHSSMPKPYNNIILLLYSGADEAISRNSNTNTFTPQHQIPRLQQTQPYWRLWALRFSPFFNSAARRYYTRTSRYRTLVGLTKLASVIQTQTFHQSNTSNMALLV